MKNNEIILFFNNSEVFTQRNTKIDRVNKYGKLNNM